MPLTKPDLRAVLFDLDDTLNDRQQSWMAFVDRMVEPITGHLGVCAVADVHRSIVLTDQGGYREKAEFSRN
jgi:putative hydrolase of the HAD superfamily